MAVDAALCGAEAGAARDQAAGVGRGQRVDGHRAAAGGGEGGGRAQAHTHQPVRTHAWLCVFEVWLALLLKTCAWGWLCFSLLPARIRATDDFAAVDLLRSSIYCGHVRLLLISPKPEGHAFG